MSTVSKWPVSSNGASSCVPSLPTTADISADFEGVMRVGGDLYVGDGSRVALVGDLKEYLVKNLYGMHSESIAATMNGSATVTTGQAVVNAPAGIKSAFKVTGASWVLHGAPLHNTTDTAQIAADFDWYIFSFYAYAPNAAGATNTGGALLSITTGGNRLSLRDAGGSQLTDKAGLLYNFDTPTGVLVTNGVATGFSNGWIIEDAGNGWRRFSRAFQNNGTAVSISPSFDPVVGSENTLISGCQVDRVSDGASLLPFPYVGIGDGSPYFGKYGDGISAVKARRLPFRDVALYIDSYGGSGTSFKWGAMLCTAFGRIMNNGIGGTKFFKDHVTVSGYISGSNLVVQSVLSNDGYTNWSTSWDISWAGSSNKGYGINSTAAVAAGTFPITGTPTNVGDAQNPVTFHLGTSIINRLLLDTSIDKSHTLCIMHCSINDSQSSSAADYVSAARSAVAALGHNNYLFTGMMSRYDGTEDVGSAIRTYRDGVNAAMAAAFPYHFVDLQSISVNAYRQGSATIMNSVNDAGAYAVGRRPPSLVNGGDGVHPVDAENAVLMNAVTSYIKGNFSAN